MAIRTLRERVIQTLAFEIIGLALTVPLYQLVFGAAAGDSLLLIGAVAAAVLVWSPIHNTLFDIVDFRMTGRVASDRPHGLRVLHAVTHEASSVVLTLPIIMALGDHGFWRALAIDLGLTLFYAVYAYVFHLAFDRLRPVRA